MFTRSTPYATVTSSLDISKFQKYGHKIIFYDAASDPGINTLITLSYYNGMAKLLGGLQKVQNFSRLYLVPNMSHCSGGPATDQFDVLTPLTRWDPSWAARRAPSARCLMTAVASRSRTLTDVGQSMHPSVMLWP